MITVYVQENGETRLTDSVDPAWIKPASGVTLWVDLVKPTPEEGQQILGDLFHFHPLAIEDALSEIHHPKIESYGDYLYLILHGIDYMEEEHFFATRDVDFFLGSHYLVTVHDGHSRSIARIKEMCQAHKRILAVQHLVGQVIEQKAVGVRQLGQKCPALSIRAGLLQRGHQRTPNAPPPCPAMPARASAIATQ